jgi:transcription-repair coupling factor (superfamily II helicase)
MSIAKVERRLKALCPKARIVIAHGQMDSRTLARKMREFERGDHDILLSTTIIESGIDIPRANTIIIDQAEMFGMADLYQLRGRVGRSSKRGFAYFLLPGSGIVDSEARERLAALKRHGGLGGGFNLAVRDLELRGAGNLLGSQQSGHIAAVGFSLYCQLLRRTIAVLKGEKIPEIVDVRLNLDFIDLSPASGDGENSASLPYEYVEEDSQRMNFMKRLAEAADAASVKAVERELKDRFGRLPPAARRLLQTARLRVECAAKGISHIDVKDDRAVFYRCGSREVAFVTRLKMKTAEKKISELSRAVAAS